MVIFATSTAIYSSVLFMLSHGVVRLTIVAQALVLFLFAIITAATMMAGGLGPGNVMLFIFAFMVMLATIPKQYVAFYSALGWLCYFTVLIYELYHPEIRFVLNDSRSILISDLMVVSILGISFYLIMVITHSYMQERQENHRKTIELKQKNQEIAANDVFKNKLFAILSHDLRSPVQNLSAILDLLGDNRIDQNDLLGLVPEIRTKVAGLSNYIDMLLDWSRVNLKDNLIKQSQILLKKTVDDVVAELDDKIKNKGLSIATESLDIDVMADEKLLRTVLRNLLYNAIKFSKSSGIIKITGRPNGDYVVCHVEDQGVGMSQEVLERLFSNDLRSSIGTQGEKGTGLGLILCKDFVIAMGGDMWVESEEGQGTTISFSLSAKN